MKRPIEITTEMHRYRECMRNVWNTYFYPRLISNDEIDWDLRDSFYELCPKLLHMIALWNIAPAAWETPKKIERFETKIWPEISIVCPSCNEMLFALPSHNFRKWEALDKEIDPKSLSIRFMDFFDWQDFGPWDLQYVQGHVEKSKKLKELEGAQLILPAVRVRFFYSPPKNGC